jgi:hypothetical protein
LWPLVDVLMPISFMQPILSIMLVWTNGWERWNAAYWDSLVVSAPLLTFRHAPLHTSPTRTSTLCTLACSHVHMHSIVASKSRHRHSRCLWWGRHRRRNSGCWVETRAGGSRRDFGQNGYCVRPSYVLQTCEKPVERREHSNCGVLSRRLSSSSVARA